MAANESSSVRKTRGVSKKTPNWGKRKLEIEFDSEWQPCGGEYTQLATQLGFFVKDGSSFPLTAETWNDIETASKERIWAEIQDNTNAPEEYKPFCLKSMAHLWRDWKHRVKKMGYFAYNTDDERLANCPPSVVKEQWATLVLKWGEEESKKIAKTNKDNRAKQAFMHRTGKMPLAVLKKQREVENKSTDRLSIFIASRTDKDGKAKDRTTQHIIDKLADDINELSEEDRNSVAHREKVFVDNFGNDGHGRVRCMGRGITPSMVYGRKSRLTGVESATAIREELEAKMEEQKAEFEKQILADREAQKLQMETQKLEMEAEVSRRIALEMEAFKKQFYSQIKGKKGGSGQKKQKILQQNEQPS